MNEFNNRMSAQRKVLHLVNRKKWEKEQLFGLSSKAIERWVSSNSIPLESKLVGLLRTASARLQCLATKSQEQVSDDYKRISTDIEVLTQAIEQEVG